jgi:hypothetical protein
VIFKNSKETKLETKQQLFSMFHIKRNNSKFIPQMGWAFIKNGKLKVSMA